MIPVDYWHDIDARLESLLLDGVVKLPSIGSFDLERSAIGYRLALTQSCVIGKRCLCSIVK
jgi:hypothetical protein